MKRFLLSTLAFIYMGGSIALAQCDCKVNMSFEKAAGPCFGENCRDGHCVCLPDNMGEVWGQCGSWGCGSTDIGPKGDINMALPPTDGSSYMSMTCGNTGGEGNGFKLCEKTALKVGEVYSFSIDLAIGDVFNSNPSAQLQIYGGMTLCDDQQLLWESPAITDTKNWTKVTQFYFAKPLQAWTYISFKMKSGGSGSLGVDNWKSLDGLFPPQPSGVDCGPTVVIRDTSVCANGCTQLVAIGKGGTPGYTYSWSPAATGASITVCPGAATKTYTVTLTDAAGKTATATGKVNVNAAPTVTVNAAEICPGGSATLTASGATTYSWSPSTGLNTTTGTTVTASPAKTTTYTVVGTNASGCKDTATSVVTVHPKPDIQAIGGTICPNDSIQLKATNAATYTWTPAGSLTNPNTATPMAHPSLKTVYTVIGIDAFGCKDTATATVDIVNNLIAVVSVDTTICKGASVQLFASGGSKFIWTPGTGLSSTIIANPVASPTITTTYEVTVSSGSCTGKKSVTITVKDAPLLTATGGTICPGDSVQLMVTDAHASPGITYSWLPATDLSNPAIANPYAHPTITTTYTVTGSNASGCKSTATATVTISNNIVPVVSADTSICIGASAQLKASGGSKFLWSPATGLNDSTIANPVANPLATTTYQVVVSSGSCTGTKQVTVNVNPLPSISATSATICEKESATLTVSGANTYQWIASTGAGPIIGSSVSVTPAVTTTYTIIGTDPKGCKDTTATTVTVNPAPTIMVNSETVCNGTAATLIASGGVSYTWKASTGAILPSTSSVTQTPVNTATYTVTGTGANGCKNTAVATITVNPIPDIAVNSGTVCKGKSFTIKAVGAATTYSWVASDNTQLPSTDQVVVNPTTATTYTVTGTAKGCSDTAISKVDVNPIPVITVNNAAVCARQEVTLTATGGTTYLWSTNATTPKIVVTPSISTSYTVTGTQAGCSNAAVAVVTVYGNPVPSFYPNIRELSEDEPKVIFYNASTGRNLLYTWNFGDDTSSFNTSNQTNPSHMYSHPATYTICMKATDSINGCVDSTCKDIVYKPQWTIYVPNAFTPGNPEYDLNNVFYAYGTNILKFRMLIFDRWGNQIFESNDLYKGWDGKVKGKSELAQEDVYVWKIDMTDPFNKEHQYIGHVTLVK
jgi:gliding motility-associated-like protein